MKKIWDELQDLDGVPQSVYLLLTLMPMEQVPQVFYSEYDPIEVNAIWLEEVRRKVFKAAMESMEHENIVYTITK